MNSRDEAAFDSAVGDALRSYFDRLTREDGDHRQAHAAESEPATVDVQKAVTEKVSPPAKSTGFGKRS